MLYEILSVLFVSILIDVIIGELPGYIHPVVFMGKLIQKFKDFFLSKSSLKNRFLGFTLTIFLFFTFAIVFAVFLYLCKWNNLLFILMASLLFSTTFAIKSLLNSVHNIYLKLNINLEQGRKELSFLVSRNTQKLSCHQVVSAAIETLTENITDSIVSPIFYFIIFALIGVGAYSIHLNSSLLNSVFLVNYQFPIILGVIASVSYRVINTLDAMVGYKDSENLDIGWIPAKTDDYINYIPARLTGFLIVCSSFLINLNYGQAWSVMLKDARKTPSPNSGYPMAAAAGALGVQLEKPDTYILGNKINDLSNIQILKALKLTKVTVATYISSVTIITTLLLYFSNIF